jgi:hypothetical protein
MELPGFQFETLPLFIEVLAPSQERSCLCVVGVDFNSQVFSNGF